MSDEAIIAAIKKNEGWPKYTNRATDYGGPTKGGVTLDTLRAWRHQPSLTPEDLKALTETEADAIYRHMYVRPFDAIPDAALRHYLVDLGVLRGPRRAIQMLQDVVGVESDGIIGRLTLGAIDSIGARLVFIMLIGARQFHIALRVTQNASQAEYVRGWRRRNLAFLKSTDDRRS